jgi:hypothetical protein
MQFRYKGYFKQSSHLAGLSPVPTHYALFSKHAAILKQPLQFTQKSGIVKEITIWLMICVVVDEV